MRIIMATTNTCTLCPMVMKQLDKVGITYEAIDITVDADMHDLVTTKLGYMQVPVFILLDGNDTATATVLDHCGSYDKSRLRDWETQITAVAA